VRRIAYLERKLGASLVDVGDVSRVDAIGLLSYPNPAAGRVRFAIGDVSGEREAATVLVFSVSGRLVARVPIARAGVADWEGRDLAGRVAPSGLYFARLEGDRNALGTKFMLLR